VVEVLVPVNETVDVVEAVAEAPPVEPDVLDVEPDVLDVEPDVLDVETEAPEAE
jgi:hypothetical protein